MKKYQHKETKAIIDLNDWEEVKQEPESEVTILEFKGKRNFFRVNKDGLYVESGALNECFTLKEMLHKENCIDNGFMTITKVIRNSDKVEFEVGGWFNYEGDIYKLTSFGGYGKKVIGLMIQEEGACSACLSSITPATFAYNSEDGKPMLEGQEYYYTNRHTLNLCKGFVNRNNGFQSDFANFHTKADAEKWIAEQKALNKTFTLSELKKFEGTREEFINQKIK